VLGLFLALGGFNPVYFALVKLVPGFGLFRAPARWLALYAVGVSGLAGTGFDSLRTLAETPQLKDGVHRDAGRWRSLWVAWAVGVGLVAGLVLLGQLVIGDQHADLAPMLGVRSVILWLAAVFAFGAGIAFSLKLPRLRSTPFLTVLLILLVIVELLGASFTLPFNRATAPGALTSLRPAVAHLLGEAQTSAPGAADRYLSISDIFFDPGDKPEIEAILQPQLADDAVYDYLIATKQKEVLVPNLALYYRLSAIDGYDGGVLPLERYVTLERLYMPGEQLAVDGRLREHLDGVPDGRWLSLFNVRHVVTDKVRDAWFDGVFYDLQMGATLRIGDDVAVGYMPALAATALGVVYRADGAPEGTPLAGVNVIFEDDEEVSLPLVADAASTGDRVARLRWDGVSTPVAVSARGAWDGGDVIIRGLSLIDDRTGVFMPLIVSDSGRYRLVHSGDVKVYENLDVLPRLFFVPNAIGVNDDEAALQEMRDPEFNPTTTVILVNSASASGAGSGMDRGSKITDQAVAELTLYEPERVVASVLAPTDGWLLLSDAWYPGWEATVDGEPMPVERANILFRAVSVPEGEHQVEWVYRPASFRLGVAVSLGTLGLLLIVVGVGVAGIAIRKLRALPP
jgi:hypothetical protein